MWAGDGWVNCQAKIQAEQMSWKYTVANTKYRWPKYYLSLVNELISGITFAFQGFPLAIVWCHYCEEMLELSRRRDHNLGRNKQGGLCRCTAFPLTSVEGGIQHGSVSIPWSNAFQKHSAEEQLSVLLGTWLLLGDRVKSLLPILASPCGMNLLGLGM